MNLLITRKASSPVYGLGFSCLLGDRQDVWSQPSLDDIDTETVMPSAYCLTKRDHRKKLTEHGMVVQSTESVTLEISHESMRSCVFIKISHFRNICVFPKNSNTNNTKIF